MMSDAQDLKPCLFCGGKDLRCFGLVCNNCYEEGPTETIDVAEYESLLADRRRYEWIKACCKLTAPGKRGEWLWGVSSANGGTDQTLEDWIDLIDKELKS